MMGGTEDRILKGQRARALAEDAIMVEVFASAEQEFIRRWRESHRPEEREAAWHGVNALEEVRKQLRILVSDGEYAERVSSA